MLRHEGAQIGVVYMPGTRKLGRTTDHRMAMLRAMVTFLIEKGRIETTATRAKEVQSMTEKMITFAKEGDLPAKRRIYSFITKEAVSKKLIDEIAPLYADRNGGYTRVVRIGPRRGDAAEMAIIELIDYKAKQAPADKKAEKKAKKEKPEEKAE